MGQAALINSCVLPKVDYLCTFSRIVEKLPRPSWLFRHDFKVVTAECRSAFSGWGDRALLLVMLLVAIGILKSAAEAVPVEWLATAAAITGAAAGAIVQNVARTRLRFFAEESTLAHEALRGGGARAYLLSLHCTGLALLLLPAIAFRAAAVPILAAGYACGAAAIFVLPGVADHRLFRAPFEARLTGGAVRRWFGHPAAGAVAALAVAGLAWFLDGRTSEIAARSFFTGFVVGALLILGRVDHAEVRFDAVSGLATSRSLRLHIGPTLLFLAVLIPLAALTAVSAAAIAALAGTVAIVFGVTRICLYRAHSKRTSDVLLAVVAGALALMAMSAPILLPPAALAVALLLWRRSAGASWLIP